jgi:hypothetical protein
MKLSRVRQMNAHARLVGDSDLKQTFPASLEFHPVGARLFGLRRFHQGDK